MNKKIILLLGLLAILPLAIGCATTYIPTETGRGTTYRLSEEVCCGPTRLDLDYGTSHNLAIFNQILNPEAEKLDEKHMPLCHPGELSAMWRQAGLQNVREQPIDISMRFASLAGYWNPFLLGQGPAGAYVRHLDRDKLQALRDEVKYRLPLSAEDTPFVLPARVWSVRGIVPNRL